MTCPTCTASAPPVRSAITNHAHLLACACGECCAYCTDCGGELAYYQWPAVDEFTGDHIGDYRVYVCHACGTETDVS